MTPLPTGQKVFIIECDFGVLGRAFAETEPDTDQEAVIQSLMSGDFPGEPRRIVAFDPDQADVSADIAQELVRRAWHAGVDLPDDVRDFCGEHVTNLPPLIEDIDPKEETT